MTSCWFGDHLQVHVEAISHNKATPTLERLTEERHGRNRFGAGVDPSGLATACGFRRKAPAHRPHAQLGAVVDDGFDVQTRGNVVARVSTHAARRVLEPTPPRVESIWGRTRAHKPPSEGR